MKIHISTCERLDGSASWIELTKRRGGSGGRAAPGSCSLSMARSNVTRPHRRCVRRAPARGSGAAGALQLAVLGGADRGHGHLAVLERVLGAGGEGPDQPPDVRPGAHRDAVLRGVRLELVE